MVSNLYLKFSELQLLEGDDKPFGSLYGATSSAVLTEFLSPQEIIDMPEEDLLTFLAEKSRYRICDISKTSELLRKAARDSYRLDKCMYEPLNISLASSFNCIHAYQKEIKLIEQAIEKSINGMNPNALVILQSIPGIGPIWASGILSEIGDITVLDVYKRQVLELSLEEAVQPDINLSGSALRKQNHSVSFSIPVSYTHLSLDMFTSESRKEYDR